MIIRERPGVISLAMDSASRCKLKFKKSNMPRMEQITRRFMNVSNTGKRRRYKIEARLSPFVTTFVPLR
jgi:hypothetical protein